MPTICVNRYGVATVGSASDAETNPRFGRVCLRVDLSGGQPLTPREFAEFPGIAIASADDFSANVLRTIYVTPQGKIVLYLGCFHEQDRRAVGELLVVDRLADLRTLARDQRGVELPESMISEAEGCLARLTGRALPNDFDAIQSGPRDIDSPFNRMRSPDLWSLPYRQLEL